ncbi:hypothetical protein EWM64_g6388 [Hericium alpestre]|uniref:Uncharacterized protein n=1 Tax=Hericium alpestre TaxID=135208 RepID=A0A4Y9ZTR4_9AGAM|nr:hypothetical protein EWM64_g6388 [Hericium alpestre]
MFKINERLDKIQPAEAAFEVTDGLMAFEVITCPDLSAYISKDHPVELIMVCIVSILIMKETWEIPSMKDDPKKWRAVVKCVRKRLTSWCYIIKQAINESSGAPSDAAEGPTDPTNSNAVDILELCHDIKSRHKTVLEKEPDIEMLSRIAFLRHAHAKYSKSTAAMKSSNSKESGFWKYVDKELDTLCQLHNGNNKKISQVLLRILKTDQKLYGSVELPSSKMKH